MLLVVVEIFCVAAGESKLSDYSSRLQTEQQVAHSAAITQHHTSTGTTSQDVEEFSENIKRTEAVINEDFRDLKLPLLKQLCA